MNTRKDILDPIIIAGIILSVGVALLVRLTGIQKVEGLLIALLGIIITLQLDQIARLRRNQLLKERRSDIVAKMERVEWLSPLVGDIVDCAVKISTDNRNDHFIKSAKFHVEKCKRYLKNLSDGYMSIPFDDQELLMASVNAVQKCMRSVSVGKNDEDFWISSNGKRYWNANLQAIGRRNVQIERIFIYDKMTDALQKVITQQEKAGVKVYLVESSKAPPVLRIDMAIFDEDIAYEARLSSSGVAIENISIIDISEKIDKFNRLKACANAI